ncbi:shikimate kinase, partial [Dehalococcoidia bacterium]|nr:shikimate kinase [Dehalococcoidia bacterium]
MGNNIYLTGFSATGKTTVATILANLLEIRVVDVDSMIEEREGKTVPDLFSTHGEGYFREVETICMKEVSSLDRVVVSTGGGVP